MKLLLSLLFLPLSQALKLQDGNCRLAVYAPFTDERVGPPAPHRYDEDREYYGYGQWKVSHWSCARSGSHWIYLEPVGIA